MDLSLALQQYAAESGELNQIDPVPSGDAEVSNAPHDACYYELSDCVNEHETAVAKIDEHAGELEKLSDVVVSLEAHIDRLAWMNRQNIALNGPAVSLFMNGVAASLEARGVDMSLYSKDLDSMSASFESNQKDDYSTEAEEKAKGIIRRIVDAFVAGYQAFVRFVKETYQSFGKSGKAMISAGNKLKRISPTVKGVAKGKVKGKPYYALADGGKIDAEKAIGYCITGHKTVHDLTNTLLNTLSTANTAMRDGSAQKVEAAIESLGTHLPDPKTIKLAGGAEASWRVGSGNTKERLAGSSFTIEKPKKDTAPALADPLDGGGINGVGNALITMGEIMVSSVKESDQQIKALNLTTTALQFLGKKMSTGNVTNDDVKAAKHLVDLATKQMSLLKKITPTYLVYIGGVGKTAYSFAIASASQYKGVDKKDDKQGDDK